MKKVFIVIPMLLYGGAEVMVKNLAIALHDQKYNIKIICFYYSNNDLVEKLKYNKIPIIYLNKHKGVDIQLLWKLYKLFRQEKPYVLHTHLNSLVYVVLPAILNNIHCIVHTYHSIIEFNGNVIKKILNIAILRLNRIVPVAINHTVADSIMKNYHISCSRIKTIENGETIDNSMVKKIYTFNNIIQIFHVGRFVEVKNHMGLINAFKIIINKYSNVQLNLIGDGELYNDILNYVNILDLQDKVKFYGIKSNVVDLLQMADLFVLPSFSEGMPMTLIEAMALGIPILATNVGGIPNMITSGYDGLLVEPQDGEIAKGLEQLISDENLRRYIGNNAFHSSQKYTAKKMASNYAAVYFSDVYTNN